MLRGVYPSESIRGRRPSRQRHSNKNTTLTRSHLHRRRRPSPILSLPCSRARRAVVSGLSPASATCTGSRAIKFWAVHPHGCSIFFDYVRLHCDQFIINSPSTSPSSLRSHHQPRCKISFVIGYIYVMLLWDFSPCRFHLLC